MMGCRVQTIVVAVIAAATAAPRYPSHVRAEWTAMSRKQGRDSHARKQTLSHRPTNSYTPIDKSESKFLCVAVPTTRNIFRKKRGATN